MLTPILIHAEVASDAPEDSRARLVEALKAAADELAHGDGELADESWSDGESTIQFAPEFGWDDTSPVTQEDISTL